MKILIVDPVARTRESLAAFLQLQEHLEVVGCVAGAAEALRLQQRVQPDVIIMETELPDGDAFRTARNLTRLAHAPAVLLITVHRSGRDLIRALEAGAIDCLEKSAGVDSILDTLERLSAARENHIADSKES